MNFDNFNPSGINILIFCINLYLIVVHDSGGQTPVNSFLVHHKVLTFMFPFNLTQLGFTDSEINN